MKTTFFKILSILTALVISIGVISSLPTLTVNAQDTVPFRREINNESPAWIVHIDTWTSPDPQKIIDMIPEDLRPYVIFNLSMSVNGYDSADGYGVVEYAYETCKSWLRTCAENGVWATVQAASGGPCHFEDLEEYDDYEGTLYREFFEDYPNFLGFNYSEQFWGYSDDVTITDRYTHFANLLEITHEYGGYLFVSWCGNQWTPSINPLAMLKEHEQWREACELYSENYILCEKYTQVSYINDMESIVLGVYLSDYCGQWGVRYDESGWTSGPETSDDYTMSTGLAVEFERMLLNGACVIDGPELVFKDDYTEVGETTDEDGWTSRNWQALTMFINVAQDMMYKVIDGTINIPTKEEVLKRTKVVILNDVDSGSIDDKYSVPTTLTEGLYRMDDDGNLKDNHSIYKKSGRYATIPMVYSLSDGILENAELIVKKSEYNKTWTTIDEKIEEFNELYPELYTGDLYVGNYKNGWVVYNPYKTNTVGSASVPLLYNSCDTMEFTFTRYANAIVKEQSDSISIYLNNYDDNNILKTRKNIITITGCSQEPTYTFNDRAVNAKKPTVTAQYENGTFTLTVEHNSPIDITINCSGSNVKSLTAEPDVALTAPASPDVYTGPYQYEGEFFDYIGATVIKNGAKKSIDNYTGQGYINLGTESGVKVRDIVTALEKGKYTLTLTYAGVDSPSDLSVYVNGKNAGTISLDATKDLSSWASVTHQISLSAGSNTVEFRTKSNSGSELYLDNFIIEADFEINATNDVRDDLKDENSSPIVIDDTMWLIIGIGAAVVILAVIVIIIVAKKK